jgi:hypothetical protein
MFLSGPRTRRELRSRYSAGGRRFRQRAAVVFELVVGLRHVDRIVGGGRRQALGRNRNRQSSATDSQLLPPIAPRSSSKRDCGLGWRCPADFRAIYRGRKGQRDGRRANIVGLASRRLRAEWELPVVDCGLKCCRSRSLGRLEVVHFLKRPSVKYCPRGFQGSFPLRVATSRPGQGPARPLCPNFTPGLLCGGSTLIYGLGLRTIEVDRRYEQRKQRLAFPSLMLKVMSCV